MAPDAIGPCGILAPLICTTRVLFTSPEPEEGGRRDGGLGLPVAAVEPEPQRRELGGQQVGKLVQLGTE